VLRGKVGCFRCSSLQRRNADSNLPPLGRRCSPALLGFLDIQFGFRFRLFWHGGPRSKWIEHICPKTCMARTGPAMTRRRDRYQPRAAWASQPKTLKTYVRHARRGRLTRKRLRGRLCRRPSEGSPGSLACSSSAGIFVEIPAHSFLRR
jgi:hypothetical protein